MESQRKYSYAQSNLKLISFVSLLLHAGSLVPVVLSNTENPDSIQNPRNIFLFLFTLGQVLDLSILMMANLFFVIGTFKGKTWYFKPWMGAQVVHIVTFCFYRVLHIHNHKSEMVASQIAYEIMWLLYSVTLEALLLAFVYGLEGSIITELTRKNKIESTEDYGVAVEETWTVATKGEQLAFQQTWTATTNGEQQVIAKELATGQTWTATTNGDKLAMTEEFAIEEKWNVATNGAQVEMINKCTFEQKWTAV